MSCYVKDLFKGQTIFGVCIFDPVFEIYSVKCISTDRFTNIQLYSIVGDVGWEFILPMCWDLDEPIYVYYNEECIWAYTISEEKAVKLYSDLLEDRLGYISVPTFHNNKHLLGTCEIYVLNKTAYFIEGIVPAS